MGSLGGTIDSLIKSTSLTGHPIIDSIIIAHLIPIVISYTNGVFQLCKSVGLQLYAIITTYLRHFIQSKLVGNILCTLNFFENTEMHRVLKEVIFDKNVKSNIEGYKLMQLSQLLDDTNKDSMLSDWYSSRYLDYKCTVAINYDDGATIFKYHDDFVYKNTESKVFKYGDYYIKISLKEGDKISQVIIDLISFSKVTVSKNKKAYVDIIEAFLKDNFEIKSKYNYVYSVSITNSHMNACIKKFHSGYMKNGGTGQLACGDPIDSTVENKADDTKPTDKFVKNRMRVNIKHNNLTNANADYTDDLEFLDFGENEYIDPLSVSFSQLYRKYVDSIGKIPDNNFAFFCKDKRMFLLHRNDDDKWTIKIISKGKLLTESDIRSYINWIITMGISIKPNKPTSQAKNEVYISKYIEGKWNKLKLSKRGFQTIYLTDKLLHDIIKEFNNFIQVEKLYREYEIPYKKGILFYGPPGTGKTSLVKALAYEYQMNVYVINVNDKEINDDSIVNVLNSLGGEKCILLFEDIDTAFADKEQVKIEDKMTLKKGNNKERESEYDTKETAKTEAAANETAREEQLAKRLLDGINSNKQTVERKYLTYSGLLNALDGVMSNQYGVITIMTTNYIEKLGDAFLRPGRIDRKFELKECNDEQITKMTSFFIKKRLELLNSMKKEGAEDIPLDIYTPKIEEFVKNVVGEDGMSVAKFKPCNLQYYLLRNIENIDDIFSNYKDLLVPEK